jgi:hypothetical protein
VVVLRLVFIIFELLTSVLSLLFQAFRCLIVILSYSKIDRMIINASRKFII